MTPTTGDRGPGLALLVVYSSRPDDCVAFYRRLGLVFERERHGEGPTHFAAVLPGGAVLELYPATPERSTGRIRLGIIVDAAATDPPLHPGRHLLRDPDGRTVEVDAR